MVTYDSGSTYEGEFSDEKQKHGQGIFTWYTRDEEDEEAKVMAVFEGHYRDGKRNGKGKMTFPNGDEYHGEWKDNQVSQCSPLVSMIVRDADARIGHVQIQENRRYIQRSVLRRTERGKWYL